MLCEFLNFLFITMKFIINFLIISSAVIQNGGFYKRIEVVKFYYHTLVWNKYVFNSLHGKNLIVIWLRIECLLKGVVLFWRHMVLNIIREKWPPRAKVWLFLNKCANFRNKKLSFGTWSFSWILSKN